MTNIYPNCDSDQAGDLGSIIDAVHDNDMELIIKTINDPNIIIESIKDLKDQKRYKDAAEILKHMHLDADLVRLAIPIYVKADCKLEAAECLKWSRGQKDSQVYERCLLDYTQACYEYSDILDIPTAQDIFDKLEPILVKIKNTQLVSGRIEEGAAALAIIAANRLEKLSESKLLSNYLVKVDPLPIVVGRLVASGAIPATEEITDRLQADHRDINEVEILVAYIKCEFLNKTNEAYEIAINLSERDLNEVEKHNVVALLISIYQQLDEAKRIDVDIRIPAILGSGNKHLSKFRAKKFLEKGLFDAAAKELTSIADENDPAWLVLEAERLYKLGQNKESMQQLKRAADKSHAPELYKMHAEMSYKNADYEGSMQSLKKALEISTVDKQALHNIATIALLCKDHESALHYYSLLKTLCPTVSEYKFNYAMCLIYSGKLDDGIQEYTDLCKESDPSIESIITLSNLRKLSGQAAEGFNLLEKHYSQYSSDPNYIYSMLDMASTAGIDLGATESCNQLLSEAIEKHLIKPLTQEEFIKIIQDAHQNHLCICDKLEKGEIPWVCACISEGNSIYEYWLNRAMNSSMKKPGNWLPSGYCTYATHNYAVINQSDGIPRIHAIRAAPPNSNIAVDISALITLHKLGMLDKVLSFYGQLHIPAEYTQGLLQQEHQLASTPKAGRDEISTIISAVNLRKIILCDNVLSVTMPQINETAKQALEIPSNTFSIMELLNHLSHHGKIQDQKYAQALNTSYADTIADPKLGPLNSSHELLIEVHTMRNLISKEIFNEVLNHFKVYMLSEEYDSLLIEWDLYNTRKAAFQENSDLRQYLYNNDIIKHTIVPNVHGEAKNPLDDISIQSLQLAKAKNYKLLADDRVIQNSWLAECKNDPSASFGTDTLLEILFKEKVIDLKQLSDSYFKLIEWRYKFIIPPKIVLKAFYDAYGSHPPGERLMKTALYVHDCMRDPGLFCGQEKADPPLPFAAKLYMQWVDTVAALVIDVWSDVNIEEFKAIELTEWAIKTLLPSPPKSMGYFGSALANLTDKDFLSHVFLDLAVVPGIERSNVAIRSICRSLGIIDEIYIYSLHEVFNYV